MHDRLALGPAAAGTHGKGDAAMSQFDRGLCVFLPDRQQIASSPQVVALALHVLPVWLARLAAEPRLLVANPAQPGNGVGARYFRTRAPRRHPAYPARRARNRKMELPA